MALITAPGLAFPGGFLPRKSLGTLSSESRLHNLLIWSGVMPCIDSNASLQTEILPHAVDTVYLYEYFLGLPVPSGFLRRFLMIG